MPPDYVPPSAEILTEQVTSVIRWVMKTSAEAPKPIGGVVAVVPVLDPAEMDEDGTAPTWGYIRIHGTPMGRLVFESPWMVAELDPSRFEEQGDDWWKDLGLDDLEVPS